MKILILDDDKVRHIFFKRNFGHHQLTHVETASEAIKALTDDTFDAVFLDHDLGGETFVDSFGTTLNTGYSVAKWISEHPEKAPKEIYIHSLNPVGAENMQAILPSSILAPGLWIQKQAV